MVTEKTTLWDALVVISGLIATVVMMPIIAIVVVLGGLIAIATCVLLVVMDAIFGGPE